jgi:hypothetical protein
MSEMAEKVFYCQECVNSWKSSEYDIGDGDIAYSKCDMCQKPRHEVPHYYFNLPKMHEAQKGKHTGAKTPEGKERVSLNGFKHGMRSKKLAIVAPAKKDKYPDCNGCPYYEACTPDKYCPVNLTLLTQFVAAYKNNQVSNLKEFAGIMQGNAFVTLKMLFNDILSNGTLVERVISCKMDEETDGSTKEEIVKEWQDNPSLKHFVKFMELLGFTAEQQVMTPAKQTENENIEGYVKAENTKAETAQEHYKKRDELLERIQANMLKAGTRRSKDETLNEFENQDNDDTDKQ